MSRSDIRFRQQSGGNDPEENSSTDTVSSASILLLGETEEESHISLSDLSNQTRSIHRLPTLIRGDERKILLASAVGNTVGLAVLEFAIPPIQEVIRGSSDDGFFSITSALARFWLTSLEALTPILFWTMVLSLTMAVAVITISLGTVRAVREPVHWVAWAASMIPSISVIAAVILVVLFTGLFAVTLALWIVIVVAAIGCAIAVLRGLLN